jgi:uncharacterized protein YkwD
MRINKRSGRLVAVAAAVLVSSTAIVAYPGTARADNNRLNNGVFANISEAQQLNGCESPPHTDARLVEAARRHTIDVRDHSQISDDIGSDGSTPGDRARAAGFVGKVSETVAIDAAVAISGIEILHQWWYDPASRATMQDCRNTAIGVWSENSLSRTVVVAVYGQPTAS